MFIVSCIPFLLLNKILLYHRHLLNTFRPLQTNFLALPLGHSCQCRPGVSHTSPWAWSTPPRGQPMKKKIVYSIHNFYLFISIHKKKVFIGQ